MALAGAASKRPGPSPNRANHTNRHMSRFSRSGDAHRRRVRRQRRRIDGAFVVGALWSASGLAISPLLQGIRGCWSGLLATHDRLVGREAIGQHRWSRSGARRWRCARKMGTDGRMEHDQRLTRMKIRARDLRKIVPSWVKRLPAPARRWWSCLRLARKSVREALHRERIISAAVHRHEARRFRRRGRSWSNGRAATSSRWRATYLDRGPWLHGCDRVGNDEKTKRSLGRWIWSKRGRRALDGAGDDV